MAARQEYALVLLQLCGDDRRCTKVRHRVVPSLSEVVGTGEGVVGGVEVVVGLRNGLLQISHLERSHYLRGTNNKKKVFLHAGNSSSAQDRP